MILRLQVSHQLGVRKPRASGDDPYDAMQLQMQVL